MAPENVEYASAAWTTVGLGGYWELTFTETIATAGPFGTAPWSVLFGGIDNRPNTATNVAGKIRLNYTTTGFPLATRVKYTGAGSPIVASNGATLAAFNLPT